MLSGFSLRRGVIFYFYLGGNEFRRLTLFFIYSRLDRRVNDGREMFEWIEGFLVFRVVVIISL